MGLNEKTEEGEKEEKGLQTIGVSDLWQRRRLTKQMPVGCLIRRR